MNAPMVVRSLAAQAAQTAPGFVDTTAHAITPAPWERSLDRPTGGLPIDRIESQIAAVAPAAPARGRPALTGPGPASAVRRWGTTGIALATTRARAAAIRAGQHQVRTVDGYALRFPSQNLASIESRAPGKPGQSHTLARHVGETLADDVRRLEHHPSLRAAGGYTDAAMAQLATDRTIANPANQSAIGAFLANPGRLRTALARVDVGAVVGTSATRDRTGAVSPGLIPGRTATVVLIKDPTFPEGYRVLTSYPDTREAEVSARGERIT